MYMFEKWFAPYCKIIMIIIKICTVSIKLFTFIRHWDAFSNSLIYIYLWYCSTIQSQYSVIEIMPKHASNINTCMHVLLRYYYMTNAHSDLPKLIPVLASFWPLWALLYYDSSYFHLHQLLIMCSSVWALLCFIYMYCTYYPDITHSHSGSN